MPRVLYSFTDTTNIQTEGSAQIDKIVFWIDGHDREITCTQDEYGRKKVGSLGDKSNDSCQRKASAPVYLRLKAEKAGNKYAAQIPLYTMDPGTGCSIQDNG